VTCRDHGEPLEQLGGEALALETIVDRKRRFGGPRAIVSAGA